MRKLYIRPTISISMLEMAVGMLAGTISIPVDDDVETETQWGKKYEMHFDIWDDDE